jgi:hypothetical protein
MRTYSIIFDEYGKKWVMEKSMAVIEVLKIFLKEFAHDERRRPEIKELVLGLDVWEYLIYSNFALFCFFIYRISQGSFSKQ